jgi:putative transposase
MEGDVSSYRRLRVSGGWYFFTVVTHRRTPVFAKECAIAQLRHALRKVMAHRPFMLDAMVVLPDHLHCIWKLPDGDADFPSRWREIKKAVTHARGERVSVWQPSYWEHLIRDDEDWQRHVDYIHYNPVKHGLVDDPAAWPWSSFARFCSRGLYQAGWGRSCPDNIRGMDLE